MFARLRFSVVNEGELQLAVASIFSKLGWTFEREVRLTPRDRIDFIVGSAGIELKVKGQADAVWRQMARYSESPRVSSLVLLTTVARHMVASPTTLQEKPVYTVHLRNI